MGVGVRMVGSLPYFWTGVVAVVGCRLFEAEGLWNMICPADILSGPERHPFLLHGIHSAPAYAAID